MRLTGSTLHRSRVADPPDSLAVLQNDAAAMILAACGVPPEMLRQSDGTGRREAWRQFLFGSVAPVALSVADELDAELEATDVLPSDVAGLTWASRRANWEGQLDRLSRMHELLNEARPGV